MQCAPPQPQFTQRVNSMTSQVRQLNLNLSVLQNLCVQNGQSAEANVMAQATNTITQAHLQFLNVGAQLDAVRGAIQRRKMIKNLKKIDCRVSLPTTSLSDCCSTTSSMDSRSPSLSPNA